MIGGDASKMRQEEIQVKFKTMTTKSLHIIYNESSEEPFSKSMSVYRQDVENVATLMCHLH